MHNHDNKMHVTVSFLLFLCHFSMLNLQAFNLYFPHIKKIHIFSTSLHEICKPFCLVKYCIVQKSDHLTCSKWPIYDAPLVTKFRGNPLRIN